MAYKLDETPEMNNPETYVLTHNRFNTYLILIFSDLNRAQIFKMPYNDSSHNRIEMVMSFNYSCLFKPNGHKEDYHTRKPNNENPVFEIEDKIYVYVGEKVITFETHDTTLNYSSELGFKDIKYPFA